MPNKTVGIHSTAFEMLRDPSMRYSPPNLREIKFDEHTGELLD